MHSSIQSFADDLQLQMYRRYQAFEAANMFTLNDENPNSCLSRQIGRNISISYLLQSLFGSPTDRAMSKSTRERFPVPECVFDYSQRERTQHFTVVP